MGGGHFCYLPSYIESMASDGIEQITGSENFIDGLGFLLQYAFVLSPPQMLDMAYLDLSRIPLIFSNDAYQSNNDCTWCTLEVSEDVNGRSFC